MTTALAVRPPQVPALAVAATGIALLWSSLSGLGGTPAALFAIGLALGVTLYHAAFSFAGAYRRLIVERDASGVIAQLAMLAVAIVLFAPVLAAGSAFGRPVAGAVAPISVSMALGAFAFAIGMQLAGGCASGTLYTAGGGNLRMLVVLAFFCVGGFAASLHMHWWSLLPGWGALSLGETLGWGPATLLQLAVLAVILLILRTVGAPGRQPLRGGGPPSWQRLVRGPWPLLAGALLLAALNWLTLAVAGHPWSITWAFALWPAKAAAALGWDPASSPFWSGDFQRAALAAPLLADTVSVMNVGMLAGAFLAAALAGKVQPSLKIPLSSLIAAALGGLVMGYGARLAYGCNIGAFFSGVASASLHGWVWIAAAVPGTVVGIRLRRLFRLPA